MNGQPYDPGSPYAVKNFFEVMPQLSEANTRPAAMQAFQDFVMAADAEGIGVMVDAPFNHVAWDAELDEKGVEIFGKGTPDAEIRKTLPGFFSRQDDYGLPAREEIEIATAPDRDDFGKWEDVKDVYFGNYSALVRGNDPAERNPHQNEEDVFDYDGSGWNDQTRRTWKYFASYVPYWLEKTGLPAGQPVSVQVQTGIDGLRADFGQGLPPQLWEYVINVARSRKWSFVFMSEALDGGAVTYRSSRHFDVLNENIVFDLQSSSTPSDYHAAFENRRTAYGDSLVLLNNVSHDEENNQDPWQAFIRYAVASANDGVPMLFMGQELGISRTYGFSHYETNFGKQVPHFKRYNSMQPIWDNADFGLDQLYKAYASIGRARSASPALSSSYRYFLNELSTNAPHAKINAAAKWEKSVSSPSTSDLVLTFVNLDRDNQQSGVFDLSPGGDERLLGLDKNHLYNVSNLAAFRGEEKDAFLWTQARDGQDLLENGIFVILNSVPTNSAGWTSAPYEVQYLKVHDLSTPLLELNASVGGGALGSGGYSYGSHATIQATAEPGYAFDGWIGGGVANPSATRTTVSMTQSRALTATFRYVVDPENIPTISEFMASNDKTLLSASGVSYDWIEIHNRGTNSMDLSDWYLTNDPANPNMWRFPVGSILGGDERLLVFASGLGSAGVAGELHATFKLEASGGYLALVRNDGTVGKVFANYPKQEEDYAYGKSEKTVGLIARWKFDESSGTVVKDSVAPPPGLVAGGLSGSFNLTDLNLGDLNGSGSGATDGIDPLGPTLGNFSAKPPWQDNFTVVYNGQIYDADGRMSFSENIDDAVWLKVNQQVLLNDQGWNRLTTQAVDLGPAGWFDFELRMGNSSGGAGSVSSPGFGFDPEGGSNFKFPQNSSVGLGDLFRTRGPLDASILGEASPRWERGRFGNALHFDGVDDIATHVLPSPVTLATYTLSLWVKPDGVNQANYVSFFNSGSTGQDFQIGFDGGGRYKIFGDGGSGVFGPATVDWSHLAVVYDGSSRKLYMNGIYVVSVANADNVFQHYQFGVNRGSNRFFKGWLDEVRLLNLALSETQVFDLFQGKTDSSANYLKTATPGQANSQSFLGFVADTKFNVNRGLFENPFSLSITTSTPGATIRYTTDGSSPSSSHGSVFTVPFSISSTTIVRAIATKPNHVSTDVDTQSYFFPQDVILQSIDGSTPMGWPATGAVNGQMMVYGMDPDIVEGFNTPEEVKQALVAIPTLSIATEMDSLFGQANGIYVNAKSDGRTWERPMSLELINPDGSEGFQIDAGLRIRGGYSRSANNPKHSFRVFFRGEYGQGNLHYPMFEDEGVEEFDKFDLRTSQNYSWAFGGPANNTMVREVWSRDTQSAMGQPYTRSRYYHLYLNGVYWGIYMTEERVSGTLGESYFGGDKDDYDTVHQDSSRQINATGGNLEAYDRLWQRTIDGWTDNDGYFQAQGLDTDGKTRNPDFEYLLDVDNLIDYMLIVYYNGDRDGPASRFTTPRVNNYYAFYNRANPDGWKFPAHDMEHSLGRGENNMVTPLASDHKDRDEKKYFTAHFLHEQLTSNQEYVTRFADRFYLRNYNDGVLSEENAKARIAFRFTQIDKAIIAESARWGDTKSAVPKNRNDWVNNVNMITNWMTGRNAVVLNQLRTTRVNASSPFWYPSIDPPGFSQNGGQVGSSFRLSMINPNMTPVTIYYTLDGSDPRLIGGAVSPVGASGAIQRNAAHSLA